MNLQKYTGLLEEDLMLYSLQTFQKWNYSKKLVKIILTLTTPIRSARPIYKNTF